MRYHPICRDFLQRPSRRSPRLLPSLLPSVRARPFRSVSGNNAGLMSTESADHGHSGTTNGRNAYHQHGVDLPDFAGSSGAKGGGAAHSDLPPYYALAYIMKG